jgi:hypothetical protein
MKKSNLTPTDKIVIPCVIVVFFAIILAIVAVIENLINTITQ